MNITKKFQKELESKKEKFDPLDGIFVLSYDCALFKSKWLPNINSEENRKPTHENWTHYIDEPILLAAKIDDKLLYLKQYTHNFKIVGSINFRFLDFAIAPLNAGTPQFWAIWDMEQKRILKEKCLKGHELLHLRTNTKVWVSDVAIGYIC